VLRVRRHDVVIQIGKGEAWQVNDELHFDVSAIVSEPDGSLCVVEWLLLPELCDALACLIKRGGQSGSLKPVVELRLHLIDWNGSDSDLGVSWASSTAYGDFIVGIEEDVGVGPVWIDQAEAIISHQSESLCIASSEVKCAGEGSTLIDAAGIRPGGQEPLEVRIKSVNAWNSKLDAHPGAIAVVADPHYLFGIVEAQFFDDEVGRALELHVRAIWDWLRAHPVVELVLEQVECQQRHFDHEVTRAASALVENLAKVLILELISVAPQNEVQFEQRVEEQSKLLVFGKIDFAVQLLVDELADIIEWLVCQDLVDQGIKGAEAQSDW
jgi:hypothetical protein